MEDFSLDQIDALLDNHGALAAHRLDDHFGCFFGHLLPNFNGAEVMLKGVFLYVVFPSPPRAASLSLTDRKVINSHR